MQGFFVTCNRGKESKAVREICDLLDEASDFGREEEEEGKSGDPESIEDRIAKEVAEIKAVADKGRPKRFVSVPVPIEC
ncbi:hypothetical protein EV182_006764, partial [Spiromyces aspiralis]